MTQCTRPRLTQQQKQEFAREQHNELVARGFSHREAHDIIDAVGPKLAVRCVNWVTSIWDVLGDKLEDGRFETRDSIIESQKKFKIQQSIPQMALNEGGNWTVAVDVVRLINKLLENMQKPSTTEPLQATSCGDDLGTHHYPAQLKYRAERILNGALEVARYFPVMRKRIADKQAR